MFVDESKCINCGKNVKSLYKKYSPTVLKLTDCEHCHRIADKYVEYDIIIVIIDLVLLSKFAYRHILFNVEFKNFWKLFILLLMMEAYSDWMLRLPKAHDRLDDYCLDDVNLPNVEFYKLALQACCRSIIFILTVYVVTYLRFKLIKNVSYTPMLFIWKTFTISSFGIFLLLPSLIWDINVQEFHISVVALYTTLSQLLAYTAVSNCTKIWSVIVIFFSYYFKSLMMNFFKLSDEWSVHEHYFVF